MQGYELKVGEDAPAPLLLLIGALVFATLAGTLVAALGNPFWILAPAGIGLAVLFLASRLEWGMLFLVFIAFTNLSDVLIKFHGLPSITKVFVPLLVLLMIVRWLRYTERPVNVLNTGMVLVAYGLYNATSLFYAVDYPATEEALAWYAKDIAIAIVTVMLIRGESAFKSVIWVLIGAAIFLGTIGAFKYLGNALDNDFGGFARAPLKHIAGELNAHRLAGPIADPNYYASLLVFIVPLTVERLLNERRLYRRVVAGYALCVTLMSVYYTASRGAIVALAVVSIIAWLLFKRKHWYVILLLVPLALAVLSVLPSDYSARVASLVELIPSLFGAGEGADRAIQGRLGEWAVAWAMFLDHPVFGVGLANYEAYFQSYTLRLDLLPRGDDRQAHSLYLEVAAERGMLGLGVFLALIGWAGFSIVRARDKLIDAARSETESMVAAFRMRYLGYLVCLVFLHDAYPRFFWMVVAIALALPAVTGFRVNECAAGGAETNKG